METKLGYWRIRTVSNSGKTTYTNVGTKAVSWYHRNDKHIGNAFNEALKHVEIPTKNTYAIIVGVNDDDTKTYNALKIGHNYYLELIGIATSIDVCNSVKFGKDIF